eukprot:Skav205450  [mRNA]  locus=scaffold2907:148242:150709:+ [translate_table: standard]
MRLLQMPLVHWPLAPLMMLQQWCRPAAVNTGVANAGSTSHRPVGCIDQLYSASPSAEEKPSTKPAESDADDTGPLATGSSDGAATVVEASPSAEKKPAAKPSESSSGAMCHWYCHMDQWKINIRCLMVPLLGTIEDSVPHVGLPSAFKI